METHLSQGFSTQGPSYSCSSSHSMDSIQKQLKTKHLPPPLHLFSYGLLGLFWKVLQLSFDVYTKIESTYRVGPHISAIEFPRWPSEQKEWKQLSSRHDHRMLEIVRRISKAVLIYTSVTFKNSHSSSKLHLLSG